MKKCIVFGANGYLGLHLTQYLADKGIEVAAYDYAVKETSCTVACQAIDVSDSSALAEIDWNVDAVFNFAGLTGTLNGFDKYKDYIAVNEIGLLNILSAIKNTEYRPRFVLPSTRLVYKGSDAPLEENAPKEAKTIYAANKIAGEYLLETYSNMFGIDHTVFRICVPYGNLFAGGYSFGTIGFFINQARDKQAISLFGDGSLRRTFTHVEDLCRQIAGVSELESSKNQIYNTAGEGLSLKEVAQLVASKYKADVLFAEWPEKDLKIESGHTVFNSAKLEKLMPSALTKKIGVWIGDLK